MTDPAISTADLAVALGHPAFRVRLWLSKAGLISRSTRLRGVGLLAGLAGILSAIRTEAAEARAITPAPVPEAGDRLNAMVAALTADLTRIAEGRGDGPVAEEIERMIDRLPRHRGDAMIGTRR